MKIAIIGFSGTGKSTLARKLGAFYQIPYLHLDSVHFEANWQERTDEAMAALVQEFKNSNSDWIIEGNYLRICPERFKQADLVIYLAYSRLFCLKSVIHRYRTYKNTTRPDLAKGCNEKLDKDFISWVLWKGRTKQKKEKYVKIAKNAQSYYIFKNRKKLYEYLKKLGVKNYEASM